MDQINLFKEYKDAFGEEETKPKEKKERTFAYSPFTLQDALGERSAKKSWIEYQKLRIAGIEADELIFKIAGKVRDMTAIKMGAGKEDLGLSDYPYSKSKKDLKNWPEENLKILYEKIVKIYHRSRMVSGEDLDVELEKILLSI